MSQENFDKAINALNGIAHKMSEGIHQANVATKPFVEAISDAFRNSKTEKILSSFAHAIQKKP